MRCLYCGKEYWLPSQVRRDPDFCSLAHREQYNTRFDVALRRLQESSPLAIPERVPASAEIPEARTQPSETHSAPPLTEDAEPPPPLAPNWLPSPPQSFEGVPALPTPSSTAERLQPQINKPRLAVRPIFERLEAEQQATQAREEQEPAFTEIFSMLDTARINWRKLARHATTGIAASIAVVLVFWLVANAGNLGRNLFQQGAALMASFPYAGSDAVAPAQAWSTPSPTARPEPRALQRRLAWLRNAAAKRATMQLAESFDDGMAAWGIKAKGWAPGWSRSPDGYVRPGQLALFQPTLSYADYRMEFFGQIEDNSMSWVVRGKDSENYYAMKVNIVKPGLRPVISMAHYPVVEGKQGHKVEVPLSFMVHNNTPYHVSVEVTGSHYTAFIEGEEVDSWSDDTLLAGGVGFFSEAGARARIYWMKISKNDDWLGRLCKRIAGSAESRDTAWLVHPTQTPRTVGATAMIRIEPVDIFLTWRSAGLPD